MIVANHQGNFTINIRSIKCPEYLQHFARNIGEIFELTRFRLSVKLPLLGQSDTRQATNVRRRVDENTCTRTLSHRTIFHPPPPRGNRSESREDQTNMTFPFLYSSQNIGSHRDSINLRRCSCRASSLVNIPTAGCNELPHVARGDMKARNPAVLRVSTLPLSELSLSCEATLFNCDQAVGQFARSLVLHEPAVPGRCRCHQAMWISVSTPGLSGKSLGGEQDTCIDHNLPKTSSTSHLFGNIVQLCDPNHVKWLLTNFPAILVVQSSGMTSIQYLFEIAHKNHAFSVTRQDRSVDRWVQQSKQRKICWQNIWPFSSLFWNCSFVETIRLRFKI